MKNKIERITFLSFNAGAYLVSVVVAIIEGDPGAAAVIASGFLIMLLLLKRSIDDINSELKRVKQ